MDPLLLKHVTLSLLVLFNTLPSSFASKDDSPDSLPTEGTKSAFPFVNLWNESSSILNYTGDSFSFPQNADLAALLDIGSFPNLNLEDQIPIEDVPPLDGKSHQSTRPRDLYAMKFVAYDMKLGKLKTVDALSMSFTMQLQIFLQWQDWMTNHTINPEKNDNCEFLCDNTRTIDDKCCEKIWVPPLRLPNADVARMDSIVSDGDLGTAFQIGPSDGCLQNQTKLTFGNSTCYHQRFWELSVDATCTANMDFRYFPFDVQQLSMDIRNPYSSRTWFQLAPGSLEEKASNLVQKMSADASTLGWQITDVIVSPLCDVLSWKSTFLAIDAQLFKNNMNESQAKAIEEHLILTKFTCPKLYNWSGDVSIPDLTDTSAYDSIQKDYFRRLNHTQTAYMACVRTNGIVYSGNTTIRIAGWIDPSDPRFNNRVSVPCLIDAVLNLTTSGIRVSILVQRYTMYYVLKLVIPMIVCVGFAFTAFAIHVKYVADRLMVAVPAAIALTALQVTVVATDIPAISYIVPTTWLMMCSYIIQLLISVESMLVYKLRRLENNPRYRLFRPGYPHNNPPSDDSPSDNLPSDNSPSNNLPSENPPPSDDPPKRNDVSKFRHFLWTTRGIDLLLMWVLIILYTTTVILCMLLPYARLHKPDLLSTGISIWNNPRVF